MTRVEQTATSRLVESVVDACDAAAGVESLLTEVLPALQTLAEATGAAIVTRAGGQWRTLSATGRPCDLAALRHACTGGRAAGTQVWDWCQLPGSLAAEPTHVAARGWASPEHLLVLDFAAPPHTGGAPGAWTDTACRIIDESLRRLTTDAELADLRARVASAQELANMGDYDWHIETNTNRWSDHLYRIYGCEPQSFEATYEVFLGFVHPDDREAVQAIHQRAYEGADAYHMIERIVRPSGEVRHLSSDGRVLRDAHGTPVRMRGTCVDITGRVHAEAERERAAARFRGLVEAHPDAMLVVDESGRIASSNAEAGRLFGPELSGRHLTEILPDGDRAGEGLAATGAQGQPLLVDIRKAALEDSGDRGLQALFVADAAPRLAHEALATTVAEARLRQRQAVELNDTILQSLTALAIAMEGGDVEGASEYLAATMSAGRRMMRDWLHPLDGGLATAGDLVRSTSSTEQLTQHRALPTPRDSHDVLAPPTRVVIIDDSADLRRLLTCQLAKSATCAVVGEAGDGEEGIRVAAQTRPDVVLLDLSMPRMDGLQALPVIRREVPECRVIVMSGFGYDDMAEQALTLGAARYVEKGLRMNLPRVIDELTGTDPTPNGTVGSPRQSEPSGSPDLD